MKNKIIYRVGIILDRAILTFAYYALSPLFINSKVDDANPAVSNSKPAASFSVVGTTGHPASGIGGK